MKGNKGSGRESQVEKTKIMSKNGKGEEEEERESKGEKKRRGF